MICAHVAFELDRSSGLFEVNILSSLSQVGLFTDIMITFDLYIWNIRSLSSPIYCHGLFKSVHDDVIKRKHFPRYWPFARGIHRSPVNSPHKGQWRGALVFSLICVWINGWVSNREAGDLRSYPAHYDFIVMLASQINWSRPEQNVRHFAGEVFKWISYTHSKFHWISSWGCCWHQVSNGWGVGLVPADNKTLPQPKLTHIYMASLATLTCTVFYARIAL